MLTDQEYAAIAHRADQLEAQAERALDDGVHRRATVAALLAISARLEVVHEQLRAGPELVALGREERV